VKNLDKFLDYIDEADNMIADVEKDIETTISAINDEPINDIMSNFEGGDYKNFRVAIKYDGTQGSNGWYWNLIDGKNIIASGESVFRTADDAKMAAEEYIESTMEMEIEPESEEMTESKVQIMNGSGVDSGKKGTLMTKQEFNKQVKTDGRGVPKLTGHYKPVDWNKEVAIKLDNGEIITMFKNRVKNI